MLTCFYTIVFLKFNHHLQYSLFHAAYKGIFPLITITKELNEKNFTNQHAFFFHGIADVAAHETI